MRDKGVEFKRYFNPDKAGLCESSFFGGRGQFDLPLLISRRTYLMSIQLYAIVGQPIWSRLKVKNGWYQLLHTDIISLLGNPKNRRK